MGAVGTAGCVLMTTGADAAEVHPVELVTVNVCEPATSPVTVTVEVDPVILPGLTVQLPAGRPPRTTLPVETVHVGWVMVPIVGAEGRGLTVTAVTADCALWQPAASATLTQ
jgi:hypothetical protein